MCERERYRLRIARNSNSRTNPNRHTDTDTHTHADPNTRRTHIDANIDRCADTLSDTGAHRHTRSNHRATSGYGATHRSGGTARHQQRGDAA